MLTHIHIRDLVIVDELELPIAEGMTALTGETGAGKSILVDALGLALGDRGSVGWIRHGRNKAEITVSFGLDRVREARNWLAERDLEAGDEVHIRRILGADGRSRGYINGRPSPMAALRELGEKLVDIHGQHEHQSLLRRDAQRQLLDAYAESAAELADLADTFKRWREAEDHLQSLRDHADERRERLDLLRFQTGELEALGLREGEIAELEEEHARLANAERLTEGALSALEQVYEAETGSAYALLSTAIRRLQALADTDPKLQTIVETLTGARIQADEAAAELRHYRDHLELDAGRLDEIEQRLGGIHELSRKHRVKPEALPAKHAQLDAERETLENAGERLDEWASQVATLESEYRTRAKRIGRIRRDTATKLSADVTAVMQDLGMQGGRFHIDVTSPDHARPAAHGLDRIAFQVSANPGQPLRALNEVASGGELSRISLAIQVISAKAVRIPTLIFDEVDSGIGGGVAEVVGRLLKRLGGERQVLCVTHLPQVAAQAHQHLQVAKTKRKTDTRTRILALDGEPQVREIARMSGGVELTKQTLAHARDMIQRAQNDSKRKKKLAADEHG